ncbi:PHP domain-containing protein [bacterium]|nr:PHP domain-containing protein [bacterium]
MTGLSVDLHIHTSYSDGLYSPEEIVRLAHDTNLKGISITDHDTIAGVEEARIEARELGIDILSGVELSCELEGYEIHILGYFAPGRESELEEKLEWYQMKRTERASDILDRLKRHGIELDMNEVRRFSKGKSIGRLHVAKALIAQGRGSSIHEIFSRYLGPDGLAYVPKVKLAIPDAVDLIHEHQGVAVLAHPGMYRIPDAAERTVDYLDGIEVWYPEHSPTLEDTLYAFAIENRLIPTGGSDFHGVGRIEIGHVRVSYTTFTRLLDVAVGV